jgi:hypothetical protein
MPDELLLEHWEKSYLFINTTPLTNNASWKRSIYSTDFAIEMNAETEEIQFIGYKGPTNLLSTYAPTLEQTQYCYEGDPVYDFIFNLYYSEAVGSDAETDVLIVHQTKSGDEYLAWKWRAIIEVTTDDKMARTLAYTIHKKGDTVYGTATVNTETNTPVFTPAVVE